MQELQANCNCTLNCTLGSAQALLLRGMRDCLLYVNDVVVGRPGTQGRLGGALAQAGGKPAYVSPPPAEVTGRSPKTQARALSGRTGKRHCTWPKLFHGASVPLRAKAREVHGLCWLENMKIRCGPNIVLVGFARDVKLECFGQPELGFHFRPNLVHLGNYPIQFGTAPTLVPTDVGCGRILQETNISDGVCVRCPQHVPEQPCGFFLEVFGEAFYFSVFVVVFCAFVDRLAGKLEHSDVCVCPVNESGLQLEYLSEAF